MNQIAIVIAIKVNDQKIYAALPNISWPTRRMLKALARCKLARLKRSVQQVVLSVAMAIIPMPQAAVA